MDRDGEYLIKTNNYPNLKGVMLCARPEENQNIEKDRAFCSRVSVKDQVGINPIKTFTKLKTKKSKVKIIEKKKGINLAEIEHKMWLKNFEAEMQNRKYQAFQEQLNDIQTFEKIREKGAKMRKWAREGKLVSNLVDQKSEIIQKRIEEEFNPENDIDYHQIIDSVIKEVGQNGKMVQGRPPTKKNNIRIKRGGNTHSRNKKNRKPAWAMTEKQREDDEFKEDDEILDFIDDFDCHEYIADVEVKNILADMKDRISEIKVGKSRGNYSPEKSNLDFIRSSIEKEEENMRKKKINKEKANHNNYGNNPFENKLKNRKDRGRKKFKQQKNFFEESQPEDPYTVNSDMFGHRSPELMEKIVKNIVNSIIEKNPEFTKVKSKDELCNVIEKQVKKLMTLKKVKKPRRKKIQFQHLKRAEEFHFPAYSETVNLNPNINRPGYKKQVNNYVKKNSVQNLPYLYRNPAI